MRTIRLLCGLVLIAGALAAQSDIRPATIEGVVKNLRTGDPLPDVRVSVIPQSGGGAKTATTDPEGRFSIANLTPGRYEVSASRTLFFRPRRDSGATVVSVISDQRLRDVQILLLPTGVIAGRILDENREPLRSVRVEALRSEYRDGIRTWAAAGQNNSDDRGEYRLFNLQPGTYYVRATQGNLPTQAAPMYYPGVADSQFASPVQVEAGEELSAIDIELRRTPEFSVQLRLGEIAEGSPVNFSVRRRNSLINEQMLTRPEVLPDNTYRLSRLTPGDYELFVQVRSPVSQSGTPSTPRGLSHAGTIPVNVGRENVDLGTVAVPPTVPLTGKLVAIETLPSAVDLRRLTLSLRAPELLPAFGVTVRGDGFAEDGGFTLSNVASSLYQISLTGLPPDTHLVSARAGAREVLYSGFAVTGNQEPLELRIGGPGSVGALEGAVVDARGEPAAGSTVVLVPGAERRGNLTAFKVGTADQLGAFSFRAILPGDYRLLAWEDVETGAYFDPEFLKEFEARGELVRIQAGAQGVATVRAIAVR